jgi:hypothetical protein
VVAAFCAGTSIAGTCAQPFFARMAACFTPSGPTTAQAQSPSMVTLCWTGGARLVVTMSAVAGVSGTYSQSGTTCATLHIDNPNDPTKAVFHFAAPDGETLSFDGVGNLTCPDGSQAKIKIGTGGPDCAELARLIGPSDHPMTGTCP